MKQLPMADRFSSIQLLLLDVDGVLTNGTLFYGSEGEVIKAFNVKDGLGIRLLLDAGIGVGIITGRKSESLSLRCRDLGIELLFDGIKDKVKTLDQIVRSTGIPVSKMAFMGDDLPDIAVMQTVGLPLCPSDAVLEVTQQAYYVSRFKGGQGAVREICEIILQSKGIWQSLLSRYVNR